MNTNVYGTSSIIRRLIGGIGIHKVQKSSITKITVQYPIYDILLENTRNSGFAFSKKNCAKFEASFFAHFGGNSLFHKTSGNSELYLTLVFSFRFRSLTFFAIFKQ